MGYAVRCGVFCFGGSLWVSTSKQGASCYDFVILGGRWGPFVVQRVPGSNMMDYIVDLDIGIQLHQGRYGKDGY